MTRKDQTTRAWISRESTRHNFLSHVSHKGKVNTLRTQSKLRKAAIEFNILHTINTLTSLNEERLHSPKGQQTEIKF